MSGIVFPPGCYCSSAVHRRVFAGVSAGLLAGVLAYCQDGNPVETPAPPRIPDAAAMEAYLLTRPEEDLIRWADPQRGGPLSLRILRSGSGQLEVEKTTNAAADRRILLFESISFLEFHWTAMERELHRTPSPQSIPALRVLWNARSATLGIPGSNAGETGLALVRALRLSTVPAALDEAEKLAVFLGAEGGPPAIAKTAREERETIAFVRPLRNGTPEGVEKRAWEVTETAMDENEDLMLLATARLAEIQFARLKEIEEQNPRWEEDEEVKPDRDRAYHLSLDLALYPSLFHGTRGQEAASGLWRAARLYQYTKETDLRKQVLEDLVALYPDSPEAREARPILVSLAKPMQAEEAAAPPEEKPDAPTEDKPTPPPPPKRYNLFTE